MRLKGHTIVLLHKQSIDIAAWLQQVGFGLDAGATLLAMAVPDACLGSIASYNNLMLQAWFYRLFAEWTYILIFQLDAWVLGEDLAAWLQRGYSYIGAPWTGHLGDDTPDVGVGNGGFSLRRVDHMIRAIESPLWRWAPVFRGRELAFRMTLFRRYHLFPRRQWPLLFCKRLLLFLSMALGWRNNLAYFASSGVQEDHLLSVYAPLVFRWLRIPSMPEAAAFSVETNPRATCAAYGIVRPFGCHAWQKHDPGFWLTQFPGEFVADAAPRSEGAS